MTVIARDGVASDHLVYAWPFPLGPECEVTCADDEQVVMCPAWLVGDRLGPGRHIWRSPDPTRPVGAFFVLTAPVEVSFDMTTMFVIPTSGMPVRLRASGSLQIRCSDPGLLIAQFVGLPFDHVNEGILRSVSRSVERMLARLLTRRVVMAGSPLAVTDPAMLGGIVEELIAYNPTAGAVFGIDLLRFGHVAIVADDGSSPYIAVPNGEWTNGHLASVAANGDHRNAAVAAQQIAQRVGDISMLETARGRPLAADALVPPRAVAQSSPDIQPPGMPPTTASGEIRPRASSHSDASRPRLSGVEVPQSTDEITQPGVNTPVPGSMKLASGASGAPLATPERSQGMSSSHAISSGGNSGVASGMIGGVASGMIGGAAPSSKDERGAIFGIGMSAIGHGSVSGEIPLKVAPGARVLVPGPNGLMQSATVRQLLSGYYELEVGHSGETIWVPINGVVPEH